MIVSYPAYCLYFTQYFYYYGDEDLRSPRKKEPGDNPLFRGLNRLDCGSGSGSGSKLSVLG
eukprot:SAG11_NODE_10754_length_807_cov_12.738701_2_plen_60_part_01